MMLVMHYPEVTDVTPILDLADMIRRYRKPSTSFILLLFVRIAYMNNYVLYFEGVYCVQERIWVKIYLLEIL